MESDCCKMVYATGGIMSNYCTNCKWLEKRTTANKSYWKCCMPNAIAPRLNLLQGNPLRLPYCIKGNWYEVKVKQQEKKMTTEEMIKVMQGYVDGKDLQYRNKKTGMDWMDTTYPAWEWYDYEYRIKPEPKYRPLKPEEIIELVGTVIVDLDGDYYVVSGFKLHNEQPLVFIFQSWVSSLYLLKNFKYKDGTPVGKLEE